MTRRTCLVNRHRNLSPLIILLLVAGCDAARPIGPADAPSAARPVTSDGTDNVVLVWNEVMLQTIRELRFGPPMNARALACLHTAMYDAWAAYDDVADGYMHGDALRRPAEERTLANKEAAVSYAAYREMVDLFPSRVHVFNATMASLGYEPNVTTTDVTTPAGIGNVVAATLAEFRKGDGANQLNGYADLTGYASVNGPLDPRLPGVGGLVDPGRWQPLVHHINGTPVTQTWVNPNWRHVTPFALRSPDELLPPPPAPVRSGEFHRQVQELIDIQKKLTDRTKVIAEYWADGPTSSFPPGHWHEIAQWVSRRDGHGLDADVKMFFLVANAVMDASIAVWNAKSHYDYVRPITAVRWLKAGKTINAWRGPGLGSGPMDGDMWVPYQPTNFYTPPFGEYTSGHSAFSMASATVLKSFTGSDHYGDCDVIPAGSSRVEPGIAPASDVTLCWATFTGAAEEAGMSRLYGGIHFRMGNVESLKIGAAVGHRVWEKGRLLFAGNGAG